MADAAPRLRYSMVSIFNMSHFGKEVSAALVISIRVESHVSLEHKLIDITVFAHDLPFGLGKQEKPPINNGVHSLNHLCGHML